MTAFEITRLPLLSWLVNTARPVPRIPDDAADLRREYVTHLIASEGCVTEGGAQALMSLFPRDF